MAKKVTSTKEARAAKKAAQKKTAAAKEQRPKRVRNVVTPESLKPRNPRVPKPVVAESNPVASSKKKNDKKNARPVIDNKARFELAKKNSATLKCLINSRARRERDALGK